MTRSLEINLSPVVLKVTRPSKRHPREDGDVSVHFSDEHFPFHDPAAINILYQIIDYVNPTTVVGHGDTCDAYTISKYEKDPHVRVSLQEEIELAARHLGTVHALSPHAQHIWLEGNHEDRLRRLIWKLAQESEAAAVLGLPEVRRALEWKYLLGLHDLGWETFGYGQHKLLNDRLVCTHGNTVRAHSAYSARGEYERYRKSGMSGHTHRRGVYEHCSYESVNGWWELGCLCLPQSYATKPNWQQGFCVVTWGDDTSFGVEEVRIHNGSTWFRGRRFVGDASF